MEKTIETNDPQINKTLKIDSSLTIHDVAACQEKWKQYQGIKFLSIDASEVKSIDVAGLQLIIHLINSSLANSGKVQWSPSPSSSFIAQAQLCGMTNILSLSQGESK